MVRGSALAGSEPFRALLEEAYRAEGARGPARTAAPAALDRRLDQVALAGVTPPNGLRIERATSTPLKPPPPANPLRVVETLDVTDRLDRPFRTQPMPSAESITVALGPPKAPLKDQQLDDTPPLNLPRPPGLPPKGPALKAQPALKTPPAREAVRAPPPRIAAFLDDTTSPGLRDSSSGSGKIADLYRLQLEFEDTPARPLPRNASLAPLPTSDTETTRPLDPATLRALQAATASPHASVPGRLAGLESADLLRVDMAQLEDEDGIADLDMLARAMGLRGVSDVSIPSLEGAPLASDPDEPAAPDDAELLTPPLGGPAPVTFSGSGRRAIVMQALQDGHESVFPGGAGERGQDEARPALPVQRAVTPVIVKIPSRPRVTVQNRERARSLYLSAVENLAKADRVAAIDNLRLAVELDDGNPLYPELLRQLERQQSQPQPAQAARAPRSGEGPSLMVSSKSGTLRRPQEFARYRHD